MNRRECLAENVAQIVYDALVGTAGAAEDDRSAFVRYLTSPLLVGGHEWRFCGRLGFGGKLHFNDWHGAYISCYPEDRTDEREAIIKEINTQLTEIVSAYRSASPTPDAEEGNG